jgi:hypothetical protein
MHVLDIDRYRLRLALELPLARDRAAAFDRYTAELVDGDERVALVADVYYVHRGVEPLEYRRGSVEFGCDFLARVVEAIVDTQAATADDPVDIHVIDSIHVLDSGFDGQVLQGMFVRTLVRALSRGADMFFIEAGPDDLAFWREAVGARAAGQFVIAVNPKPPPPQRPAGMRRSRLPH